MADRDVLLGSLASIPARLASAARSAPSEPPADGEWPPSDVVRHLIAVEIGVWHARLAALAAEAHPIWPWLEPDRWTGEPEAGIDRLLEQYATERSATMRTLTALDDAGWARIGTHATFGVLDVGALMTRAVDHDEEHLRTFAGEGRQANRAE